MEALGTIIYFLLFRPLVCSGESCSNDNSEHGFALVDHVYRSFFADRLVSCYMSCSMQPACQSLNYNLADKTCEFNNDTKHFRPKYFVEKPTYVYADNPDSGAVLLLLFFIIIFFTYFSENNSFLCVCVCFVLCPPFFSFFLTDKNLIGCEVSSYKKKKENKTKESWIEDQKNCVISFITQFCQLENLGIARFCRTTFLDVIVRMWRLCYFLLCKLRKHAVRGRQLTCVPF